MLKLYNTLTKKIEEFRPLKGRTVGFYSCGPTVYDYVHLGNLRTYIFNDLLRRVLTYDGYNVRHVMNITDVGHLTSDDESGEDKLEKGAKKSGKTVWEVAKFYEQEFLKDIKALNILPPSKLPRATEHIPEQIQLISQLEKKGFTYETKEAVYYNVAKFPEYTRLSGQKLEEKKVGVRTEVVTDAAKKHPADFALWFKLVGKFKNHVMHWPSPWGEGFPGWHVECSAMSTKYLGQPFDIHTGGVDLILPHHTNEIAQSQAAYGKPLANFWVHGEHLLINRGKMAKSEGNFIRLQDVVSRGYSPLAFRYLVLSTHYRTKLNFSWEALEAANNALNHLYDKISELNGTPGKFVCADYDKKFREEINNNLDLPRALSLTWRLIKQPNPDQLKLSTLAKFDEVLGLNLISEAQARRKIPENIRRLAAEREQLRQSRNFSEADRLRQKIEEEGYSVKDTPQGTVIKKK